VDPSGLIFSAAGSAAGSGIEFEGWTCSSDQVRAELRRILSSAHFETSERNRRFFEYVVQETLMARGDRIKAYNIATVVFGRGDSFDPALDPVVRMEARRLRRSLELFYLVEGEIGPARIALPKGGYVPQFHRPATLRLAQENLRTNDAAAFLDRGPSILVSAFELETRNQEDVSYSDGFARQIVVGLSRFPELSVFMPNSSAGNCLRSDVVPAEAGPQVDFILAGNIAAVADVLKVKVTLLHAQSGRVIWAETLDSDVATQSVLDARDQIADRIVRTLMERITANSDIGEYLAHHLTCFESLTHFNRYRRSPRRELFLVALESLERTVKTNPDYSEALACLSQIYSDGHRFGFATADPGELKRWASELAAKAVSLAPNSSRAHHAQGIAYWFSGNVGASLVALKIALALNPNATEAMADLGLHSCLSGDWHNGVRLIENALSLNPRHFDIQRVGLSFYHFLNGDFDRALEEAQQVQTLHVTCGFVAIAIALIRLGRRREANEAVARIVGIDPLYARFVLHEFGGVVVQSSLAGGIKSALYEAGLSREFAQS
jgi:TolB-like protein